MSSEVNVVALVRGEEQYIFMFDEENRTDTLRMLGRFAADPELSFTWYDAAILSQRIREIMPASQMNTVKLKGNNPKASHSIEIPGSNPSGNAIASNAPNSRTAPQRFSFDR